MNKIIFILISFITILSGCKSQQDAAQKAIAEAEERALFDAAVEAVEANNFVLEADKITFKYGRVAYVSANTNFVTLTENKATIQMAFNSPHAGPNGIGGITVDGTASNVKVNKDKNGNILFSMSVTGIGVSANVFINMAKGSNRCTAEVRPNFNSNVITFTGNIYPTAESNVFKGRAL